MKRPFVAALVIGALVSAVVIALHAFRVTWPLDEALIGALSGHELPTRLVTAKLQYLLVVALAFGVAWLTAGSLSRRHLIWPLAILALELLAVGWICLLYDMLFEPLPSLLAAGLAFGLAYAYFNYVRSRRSHLGRHLFDGRLSTASVDAIVAGEIPFQPEAKTYEVTAVVCDIANKHDLAEECEPALFGRITQKFIQHAKESFLNAGAFIETVTGEGIVAVFGFPAEDAEQAEKATRHALALQEWFDKRRAEGKDEIFNRFDIHLGISSGTMVVTPLQEGDQMRLLTTSEPVELARRFCMANRFYGSRILIGPRTFELSSRAVVARPIDFLTGVDVRERHEIYEPLGLAANATPEEIARRDSFWNGVVLYREKRWAEAYSQFQKARGPNDLDDGPLQLYVRRLEPLALHLVDGIDQ